MAVSVGRLLQNPNSKHLRKDPPGTFVFISEKAAGLAGSQEARILSHHCLG